MMVLINILKKGEREQLSPFLGQHEIDCQCKRPECVWTFISERNLKAFNLTRIHFDKPIKISSGHRCLPHNKREGGAKYSDHTRGDALDMYPEDPRDLVELCEVARNYYDLVIPYLDDGFIHCSKRA